MRQSTPETSWEITVAQLAPMTPISSTIIMNRSSPMFSTLEMSRKYSGVFESPTERMIPDRILYRNVTGIPRNITNI